MKAIPFALLALTALSSACTTTSTGSAIPATRFAVQPAPALAPASPEPAASKRSPGTASEAPLSAETFQLGLAAPALGTVRAADLTLDPASELEPAPAPALPKKRLLGGETYTRFSLGAFSPGGDIDSLDTGYYGQISFGNELMHFLAVEASIGYLTADGPGNLELKAVPLFLNGRLQLPITVFELYGGLGLGGMFADYEFGSVNDDDFVLAGTVFLGAEFGIDTIAIGLEYRYLATEEANPGFTIEGHCALLCLRVSF